MFRTRICRMQSKKRAESVQFLEKGFVDKTEPNPFETYLNKVAWESSCRQYECMIAFNIRWVMWGPQPDLQNCERSSQPVELYGFPPKKIFVWWILLASLDRKKRFCNEWDWLSQISSSVLLFLSKCVPRVDTRQS